MNSLMTRSPFAVLPIRNAVFTRDGASSGKLRFIWHRAESGRRRWVNRPIRFATTVATTNMSAIQPKRVGVGHDPR